MNILIIGNGFDLAHKLPTRYTDFLKWVQSIEKIGGRLKWVGEIPGDKERVIGWLNDSYRPREFIVGNEDDFVRTYLDADSINRSLLISDDKFAKKFESWCMEHYIKYPPSDDMDENIRTCLSEDCLYGIHGYDALRSIEKVINDINENKIFKLDARVKDFFGVKSMMVRERLKACNKQKMELYSCRELEMANLLCKKIFYLMKDNFWLLYFKKRGWNKGTWIDFEKEIAGVIRGYDLYMSKDNSNKGTAPEADEIFFEIPVSGLDYRAKIDRLEDDLNRLILLLEIYLCEYVDDLPFSDKLHDISELKIDRVISFNYTHTFSHLYQMNKFWQASVDYIHGEARSGYPMDDNNMVLGIDNFPSSIREDEDVSFIFFKKYYQRIFKNTDCTYMNWIAKIKESAKRTKIRLKNEYPEQIPLHKFKRWEKHQIYIFGHSLDVTDKDVLRDLILNDNVKTTIFYRNKKQKRSQIANLDKVIGHEELVRRTGGVTETIHFQLQRIQ